MRGRWCDDGPAIITINQRKDHKGHRGEEIQSSWKGEGTAQMVSYLTATDKRLAILLNFNVHRLKDGIRRVAL
ncbi:MAG: hypothetical protein JWO87_1301 [Phycisphaerales bacterium]|nr:hypothetical protein [Phycisphaerales bacterium]